MNKRSIKNLLSSMLALLMVFNSFNFAYANQSGNQKASEKTRQQVLEKANQLLAQENLTERFLGTVFLHGATREPGYVIGSDKYPIPSDALSSTAWYNIWQVAAESKVMLNSYTEKLALNRLNEMAYYEMLYGFKMSNHLAKDGFYEGNFKIYDMNFNGGSVHHQSFYKKGALNPALRELFSDVAVFKSGNDLEITFALNKAKAREVQYVNVNQIATIQAPVELGPQDKEKTLFLIKVPGEVAVENLVISRMSYVDATGKEQKTGPFGVEIDYKTLQFDKDYVLPNYKQNMQTKIQNWINRGDNLVRGYLSDKKQIDRVNAVIVQLQKAKVQPDLTLNQLYTMVKPIHTIENELTLQDLVLKKITDHRESLEDGFYSKEVYTKESIDAYQTFLDKTESKIHEKNLSELMEINAMLDKATLNTILRFNIAPLKKLLQITENKNINDYTEKTLPAFLKAKSDAKQWIELNEEMQPSLNETDTHLSALLKATNKLVRKDGKKEKPIDKKDLFEPENNNPRPQEEKIYTVIGEFLNSNNWRQPSDLKDMFETKIKLIEDGTGNAKIHLDLNLIKDAAGLPHKAATRVDFNKDGKITTAEALENSTIEFEGSATVPSTIVKIVEKAEITNIDTKSTKPITLYMYYFDKDAHRVLSKDVALRINFDDKKPGFDEYAPPSDKIYTVNVRFLNAKELDKESHANATLVPRAKLEVKGNDQKLTLKLKPMMNGQNQVSGVLTNLFYYNDRFDKVPATKHDEKTIEIHFQGKSKKYTYPTAVSLPVDGHSALVKCSVESGTPVFDEPHVDDVYLEINYDSKREGYNENEADKSLLTDLINILDGSYYKSIADKIPAELKRQLENELEKAKNIQKDPQAKEQDIQLSVMTLSRLKEQIDFFIILDTTLKQVDADFKSDERNQNYSKESKDNAKKYIEDKKKEIENYLKQDNFSKDVAQKMLKDLSNYHSLLRYDITELENVIKQAEEKINSNQYSDETVQALQAVLLKAKAYVEKAKETKFIADERATHIKNLNEAIGNLIEKQKKPNLITAMLDAKLMQPSGKESMASNFLENKKVKVIYNKDLNNTTYEMTFNVTVLSSADIDAPKQTADAPMMLPENEELKNDALLKKYTAAFDSENQNENPKSDISTVIEESHADELASENMADLSKIAREEILPVAESFTSENSAESVQSKKPLAFWYKDGGEYKETEVVHQDKQKMTFRFTVAGKVQQKTEMKVYVGIMNSTNEVNLELTIPDDFYGNDNDKIKEAKDALQKLVDKAKTYQAEDFDKDSFDKLTAEIQKAEELLKRDASEQELSNAANSLQTAIDSLKPKTDNKIKEAKDALQKLVDKAKTYQAEDFDKDSFDKLTAEIQKAEELLKRDASEQELGNATNSLQMAIDSLKKKDNSNSGGGSGGSGGSNSGGSGGSSNRNSQRPDNKSNSTPSTSKAEEIKPSIVPLAAKSSSTAILTINSKNYTLTVDGKVQNKQLDVAPIIEKGRTMLPIRAIAELLNIQLRYDHQSKTVHFMYADNGVNNTIEIKTGSMAMKVNGNDKMMSAKPITKNSRILLPLSDIQKALAELGLQSEISWNPSSKQVKIVTH
ncbi:MAG: stalk domain-containing protein [Peptostreptococcaceae bacterium]|nr:stalk domain-containing protein [Peptostreptococcaceae bacterium]